MKKILIIRLSSMGDVILTTPMIRCIRNQYPTSIIDFVVDKKYSDIVKYNPHINNLIKYNKNDAHSNAILKNSLDRDYEIIDLQNNIRSKLFRKKLGNTIGIFNKYRIKKLAIVYLKKNYFNDITIPERYINAAHCIDISDDNKGLEVWLEEEKQMKIYPPENKIHSNIIKKISIAPSATHFTKRWYPKYFVKLIEMLYNKYDGNCAFDLLGDNKDLEICNYITSNLDKKIQVTDNSGKTTILDSVKIIDKSDLVISNDTGLLHITSARNVPLVAIYGSTVPAFGFVPYKVPHCICEVELGCRPCTHIGRKECPKKHFNCMKLLSPEIVLKTIEEELKK